MKSLADFLSSNSTAIFAIAGIIVGACLSFLSTYLLNEREMRLHLREKVLDKRIRAHETIMELAQEMRVMQGLGYVEPNHELPRAPMMMTTVARFDSWLQQYGDSLAASTTWLSIDLTREVYFAQDYFVNLYQLLHSFSIDDNKIPKVGAILRIDFIDLSSSLEKIAYRFFEKDLLNLKFGDLTKWHKYPLETTKKRLEATNLFRRRDEILQVLGRP